MTLATPAAVREAGTRTGAADGVGEAAARRIECQGPCHQDGTAERVGARLRALREARGLSQGELGRRMAAAVGAPERGTAFASWMSTLERGKCPLTRLWAARIAPALGLETDALDALAEEIATRRRAEQRSALLGRDGRPAGVLRTIGARGATPISRPYLYKSQPPGTVRARMRAARIGADLTIAELAGRLGRDTAGGRAFLCAIETGLHHVSAANAAAYEEALGLSAGTFVTPACEEAIARAVATGRLHPGTPGGEARAARLRAGLTLAEVARRLGTTTAAVALYETNRPCPPRAAHTGSYELAFGLPVGTLPARPPDQRPRRGRRPTEAALDPASLSGRLRAARLAAGLTCAALGVRLGVSRERVSQWERSEDQANRRAAERYEEALGLRVGSLAAFAAASPGTDRRRSANPGSDPAPRRAYRPAARDVAVGPRLIRPIRRAWRTTRPQLCLPLPDGDR